MAKPEQENQPPAKKKALTRVKGMHDIAPGTMAYWDNMIAVMNEAASTFGFGKIETPVLEKTELFTRAIGKETDVVGKEMYSFADKGKESISLRPEFTASMMRAYVEHGMMHLPQPVKLFTSGPLFRRERPQAGRYRQFHQANFESIGQPGPVADAEIIFVTWNIMRRLGLENVVVKINSIGTSDSRKEYIDVLVNYFATKKNILTPEEKTRLKKNPLRLLDSKEEKLQKIIAEAPQSIDYLDEESHEHFKEVLEYLDEMDIVYQLDHTLVRGLDYYTKTTFEFFIQDEEEAEKSLAIAAGGRYDSLSEQLGGQEAPGVGIGIGLERVIMAMEEQTIPLQKSKSPEVYLIQLGELSKKKCLPIFNELTESKIKTGLSIHKDSIKSQLRQADKNGVKLSLILGQKEALEDTILVRDMFSGIQEVISLKGLIPEVKKRLKNVDAGNHIIKNGEEDEKRTVISPKPKMKPAAKKETKAKKSSKK